MGFLGFWGQRTGGLERNASDQPYLNNEGKWNDGKKLTPEEEKFAKFVREQEAGQLTDFSADAADHDEKLAQAREKLANLPDDTTVQ